LEDFVFSSDKDLACVIEPFTDILFPFSFGIGYDHLFIEFKYTPFPFLLLEIQQTINPAGGFFHLIFLAF
jgi:hypothetical protein